MLETAKKLALEAGDKILNLQNTHLKTTKKDNKGDFATEADYEAEKIILSGLKEKFPRHNIISEEIGKKDNKSNYTWIIDPIDGTLAYFSGLPTFGVSIGLLKDKKPYIGVIYLPYFKSLYWAESGKGAYLNGQKIQIGKKENLIESIVGYDLAHAGGRKEELKKLVAPVTDEVRYTPILGCTVAGLCYLASGVYDVYLHSAYPWDFAAGAAIIREAGGVITDYKGHDVDWNRDWIDFLAGNKVLHKKILKLIK